MEKNDLTKLRGEIDRIDADLVALLNRRCEVVRAVGEYKKRHALPVFDPTRETQLLARLNELNAGPMPPAILESVYRAIMAGARDLERPASNLIYLDYAAAAPVLPEILRELGETWQTHFANPESAHTLGSAMEKAATAAAQTLTQALLPQAPETPVVWGGGASELIAAIGLALGDAHRSVWGSFRDHPAALAMQKRAFGSVQRMAIDKFAQLLPLQDVGEPAPALGFFTWVQSEVGSVLDLERLSEFRALFPEAVLVLDAVQGAGKLAYPADAVLPDVMIVSGHKIGAPGGAALLFPTKRGAKLAEKFRALREPEYLVNRLEPAAALLLAHSMQLVCAHQAENLENVAKLSNLLRTALADKILPNGKRLRLTLPERDASPYIVHCQLPGYQSGVLVRMLAAQGVMASAGSACQSETKTPSAVLTAMGVSQERVWSGLRISLSASSTEREVQKFVSVLGSILETY